MNVSNPIKRIWLLVAMATVVVALAAACGSDPTPTSAPTPTPPPSPTPISDPFLSLSSDAVWANVITLLDSGTVGCLRQELGEQAFEALQSNPLYEENSTLGASFPVTCIAQETVVSLAIARLSHSVGGLSGTTLECMRQSFAGIDFENLTPLAGGEADTNGISGLAGAVIGLLVCLDDDEAERITLGAVLGVDSDLSLKELRCVVQEADVTQLLGVFGSTDGNTPDLSSPLELLAAFSTCGVNLMELLSLFNEQAASDSAADADSSDGIFGPIVLPDPSALTAEQQTAIACLQHAFGEETFAQLLAGTYTPQFADLAKLGTCDIDLAALDELMGS
jgi:hypothetical protein